MADHLADRQAIVDLTVDYCWALDDRDWDALDRVFTPDATAELLADLAGVEAIKARVRRALEPLDDSQHLVATHQVRIDGDRATCRCYLQAQHVRRGVEGGENYIVAGRYEDEMVRTADGWRIARRVLVPMWTEGNPAVVRP
jgi:ketosteroid isomerase-like protein